jgi:PAS domain S-box-containing protein
MTAADDSALGGPGGGAAARPADAAKLAEERYRALVANLPNSAILLCDHELRIVLVDGPESVRTGYSKEAMEGRTIYECLPPEFVGLVEANLRRVLAGESFSAELPFGDLWYTYNYVPIRNDQGAVVYGMILSLNVTERRRAERTLAAREAHFRALAQATFEGIAFTEGGRIVDANEQLARMLRTTRGELLGKDIAMFVAPESTAKVMEHLQSGSEEPYEHLAVRADGSRFDAEARPRTTEVEGRPLRVTAVRDVSERKQREMERERLISELSTRNAEMEQFTYTVSHDLKSPLVTISCFLGMLERDLAEGNQEGVASDVARIGSAADKMLRLLNDLLELSRAGRVGDRQRVLSLGDVVNDALELLSGPIAERGVRVEVAALPRFVGDRTRLTQVFQNMIENAVKNMGAQPAPVIEIGVRPEPRHLVVFVRDNGQGVDPRYAGRIFGLFEKLDPKSPGNGVGLALVRRIVEFHGGRVWVESDGRTGSTFVLRFPTSVLDPIHPDAGARSTADDDR